MPITKYYNSANAMTLSPKKHPFFNIKDNQIVGGGNPCIALETYLIIDNNSRFHNVINIPGKETVAFPSQSRAMSDTL